VQTVIQWFNCWPRPWVAAGSLGLAAGIGVLDYLTGLDVSITLLHLGPVAFSTWRAGRGLGMFVAGACAVTWLGADLLERGSFDQPLVAMWNTLMLGSTFAVVAIVLAALKHAQENLEALGTYEVRPENHARAALQTARKCRPDLILLDVRMPEMDGGEVAAQLQEDPLLKGTPIVFLTALVSNEETKKREAQIGGMNYLAKPVDLAELTRVIAGHLKGSKSGSLT
jgi:CheY-like chemotaxis protein